MYAAMFPRCKRLSCKDQNLTLPNPYEGKPGGWGGVKSLIAYDGYVVGVTLCSTSGKVKCHWAELV
jgi:hypothetical protein